MSVTIAGTHLTAKLVDSLYVEGVRNDKSYWLPFARSTPLFYYNKAAFAEVGLDKDRFREDSGGQAVRARIRRDVESGIASGEVRGTPTLFINGDVHRGSYDAAALLEAIAA